MPPEGVLLDKNLPARVSFQTSLTVIHSRDLGTSLSDTDLWHYALEHNYIILSKDADFSNRILLADPPPKVVHLRFGNLRLSEFHQHLARNWSRIETLLVTHKLVNVYLDRLEAVKQ
jgi:predicted nuclease of predicted toxin-antitoxin system